MNADEDGMAMVALVEIPANTMVYFSDNEWDGTAFNGGEGYWQWVSGSTAIPVGTVIRMLAVDLISLSASHGTLTRATVAGSAAYGFSGTEDSVYAYQATAVDAAPTSFLSAICNTSFGTASAGVLANTGLSIGNGAIQAAVASGSDFFEYSGARDNQTTFAAYLGLVSNIANWTVDSGSGVHGTSVPNTTAFVLRPPVPKVSLALAPGSGKETAGTVITATVTASSAVVGDQTVGITVSGTGITATDYTLSATVVTILNGATTGTATFTVLNDADIEGTETATLTLASPSAGIELGTAITGNVQILENQPPVVRGAIPTLFAYPDETAAYTFSPLIIIDPDNDTLTYTATLADGSPLPAWITFNPATRQISATPTAAEIGTVNLKLSATDIGLPPQTTSVFLSVQVLPASTTVSINATGMAGLTIPADCSPTALLPLVSPSPAGGRFSGPGAQGNTFDPALAQIGPNVITYS
ncbi:MAG: putative Ig domain-containing protein, partial [Verrucomicrobiales bacterium]